MGEIHEFFVLALPLVFAAATPDLGFRGPGFRSARHVHCGDASRLFLDRFSKHLSSVLGQTELCHEVWNPGLQRPQIIRNENHHLALLDNWSSWVATGPDFPNDKCKDRAVRTSTLPILF